MHNERIVLIDRRMLRCDLHRLIQIRALEDVEARDLFLGLRERAVRREHLACANTNCGSSVFVRTGPCIGPANTMAWSRAPALV